MKKLVSILFLLALLSPKDSSSAISELDKAMVGSGVLSNGGFESGKSGWTVTTATYANETSTIFAGKQAGKLTYSASTGDIAQSITPTVQTNSINYEASCKVNTSLSTIQVCALSGGSEVQCISAPSSGTWQYVPVSFPGPSNGTSVGVRVKTSSSATGTVYIDDCYVGPARNLADGYMASDWMAYTPTFTGFGTVSSVAVYSRRVGSNLEVQGSFTAGTPTASGASVTIGYAGASANVSVDTTVVGVKQVVGSWGTTNTNDTAGFMTYETGGTTIYFAQPTLTSGGAAIGAPTAQQANGNTLGGVSNVVVFHFSVPISGWTSSQAAYKADATPGNWSGTSTLAGTTTSTSIADPGSVTGTVTATASRNISCSASGFGVSCTLPRAGNYQVCYGGVVTDSIATNTVTTQLTDGSNTAITGIQYYNVSNASGFGPFGQCANYNAAAAGSTTFKVRGAVSAGTGTFNLNTISVVELDAPMPAPYLTGSVTSSGSGGYHSEYAVGASGGGITAQSGSWLTSLTRTSGGRYSGVIATGEFSGTPACVVSPASGSPGNYCMMTSVTSTAFSIACDAPSISVVDVATSIICMGPR